MKKDDQEKILRIAEEWVPALRSGNVERNMAFFTEDIVIVGGGNEEIYVGGVEVRGLLTQLLDDSSAEDCSIKIEGIGLYGDWAELRAKFEAVWQPRGPGIELIRESSNYIWVLKRQNDTSWKISRFLYYPNI